MEDFKKWGDPSNGGDGFEMEEGLIPLYGLCLLFRVHFVGTLIVKKVGRVDTKMAVC